MEIFLDQLVFIVCQLFHCQPLGGESEIVHKPAVEDDPHRRRPDITRAKQLISWEPKVAEPFIGLTSVRLENI